MNRYEKRKFNAKKAKGLIATKGGLCRALGLPSSTLDAYAVRHPDLFPKPAYAVETRTGSVKFYYNKSEVVEFLEVRKSVRLSKRAVEKPMGVSKYEDFLKRLEQTNA